MKFSWLRWRLFLACLAAGLILPVVTVVQALHRAEELRIKSQQAGDYLHAATLSPDTFIALTIWTLEIALGLYLISLLFLFVRHRSQERSAA